eukprot:3941601-Rhodomonas_salina.1
MRRETALPYVRYYHSAIVPDATSVTTLVLLSYALATRCPPGTSIAYGAYRSKAASTTEGRWYALVAPYAVSVPNIA